MQTKSNLNINIGERYNALANNPPAEEFSVKNVPIHSMKKDLEMIKNPTMNRQESSPLPTSSNPNYASSPKVSPFLEKTSLAPLTPAFQKKSENITDEFIAKQSLEPEASDFSRQANLKKIFVFSTIFLSIVALGVGSYYFWLIRGKNLTPPTEESETLIPISAPVEESSFSVAAVEPEIKPEEPKENTIVLDLTQATSATIKTEIKNQIEKLPKESFDKPVEFKFKDSQNNLINFSSFAKKSGLTFAQNLSAYLGESFSLVAFNDGVDLGTGLVIESKNDLLLTQKILQEESALPKDLDVVFLLATPKIVKKVSFANSTYKDIPLRYFNLISPEKLSIDYAVAKNKLIIGTTKNTLLALYDWLSLKAAVQ